MGQDMEGILEKLIKYGRSDFYPFHMPGHKRQNIKDFLGDGFPNPYSIDITEIDGFDNLHHPEGILRASMDRAAEIYGADRTYYLVNGSTCGILSAVCGCTECGGRILMARNCHKAAYHGVILNRLDAEYLYPQFLEQYGISGGIRLEEVENALERDRREAERGKNTGKKIQAVLLVSPTYEGIVSDIRAIADIVHRYGIPLIVDEAHGAHFPFADRNGKFPRSALELGADVVIQSLHKTLPSFTQTAVLHINGRYADREKIERYLGIFQSSSPSYIFMAAMERCIRYMDGEGRREMARYEKRLERFFEREKALRVLRLLDRQVLSEPSVFDWDSSKLVVSVRDAKNLNGEELGALLRDKYHIEAEMCAPEYIIAMTSLMDTEEGLLRLSDALLEIDGMQQRGTDRICKESKMRLSELPRAVSEAFMAKALEMDSERIKLPESAGRTSKEFIYLYPPGIPILAPGERITEEILERVSWYRELGFSVQGPSDKTLSYIITVAEGS